MPEIREPLPPAASRAAAQLGRVVERALVDSELTAAGYRLLAYLSTGEVAAKTLAMKLAVSRPTVTATLDWLEPRGYVTRSSDLEDRRRTNISITRKGEDALEFADVLVGRRLLSLLSDLNGDEYEWTVAALERLHDALNRYRSRSITNGEVDERP